MGGVGAKGKLVEWKSELVTQIRCDFVQLIAADLHSAFRGLTSGPRGASMNMRAG